MPIIWLLRKCRVFMNEFVCIYDIKQICEMRDNLYLNNNYVFWDNLYFNNNE